MRQPHDIPTWAAALSAATTAGFVVVALIGASSQSFVIVAAEAAAAIGTAALLLACFLLCSPAWRRFHIKLARRTVPINMGASDCDPSLNKRLEVLGLRLNIDEPRLCTQYQIPCTCWSLCADSGNKRSAAQGASAATRRRLAAGCLSPMETKLSPVHRHGIVNCPFRFVSTYTVSTPAHHAAPHECLTAHSGDKERSEP